MESLLSSEKSKICPLFIQLNRLNVEKTASRKSYYSLPGYGRNATLGRWSAISYFIAIESNPLVKFDRTETFFICIFVVRNKWVRFPTVIRNKSLYVIVIPLVPGFSKWVRLLTFHYHYVYAVRMSLGDFWPATADKPSVCNSFVGADLRVCPPEGAHIGAPLRIHSNIVLYPKPKNITSYT